MILKKEWFNEFFDTKVKVEKVSAVKKGYKLQKKIARHKKCLGSIQKLQKIQIQSPKRDLFES